MTALSYRTCVLGGAATGVAVAAFFATRAGIDTLLWIAVAAFAICVALALAALTKVLFGAESFAFLHYQLAALLSTALLLRALGAPVLPALDLLALTLAVAQSIGRVGCASAGCCHGRPFRIGIRYGATQVATGFPEHWAGARLLPVQWIEAGALAMIAVATAASIGSTPGRALTLYAISSAVVRFALELLRGDARPHFGGLSEAQWICVATAIAIGAWQGGATMIAAALLVIAAILVSRFHRTDFDAIARAVFEARLQTPSPRNGGERVGERGATFPTVERSGPSPGPSLRSVPPSPRRAGRGAETALLISHGRTASAEHYTLSSAQPLSEQAARALAAVLRDLAHPDERVALVAGNGGIYHVVVGGIA